MFNNHLRTLRNTIRYSLTLMMLIRTLLILRTLLNPSTNNLNTITISVLKPLNTIRRRRSGNKNRFYGTITRRRLTNLAIRNRLYGTRIRNRRRKTISNLRTMRTITNKRNRTLTMTLVRFATKDHSIRSRLFRRLTPPFSSTYLSTCFLQTSTEIPALGGTRSNESSR